MNANPDIIKNFAALFAGRTDAYGSWEGGCVKESVTEARFMKHLWGQEYIGIYPLMDDSTVWWGCSDIDVNDIDQARNIQLALKLKLIESWVERTVKGFHVWVFARKPVEARVMRRALLAAHAAVKVPAREINPKQEQASGYGNYVRLPYPGALFEPCSVRYMIDSSDRPLSLETFVSEATTYAVTQDDLRPLADVYVPKQPAVFNQTADVISYDVAKQILKPYAQKIFTDGPNQGDRSGALVRLAYRLRSDGLSAEMAYSIIRRADIQWGKFYLRVDGEKHLAKIIADVYGE